MRRLILRDKVRCVARIMQRETRNPPAELLNGHDTSTESHAAPVLHLAAVEKLSVGKLSFGSLLLLSCRDDTLVDCFDSRLVVGQTTFPVRAQTPQETGDSSHLRQLREILGVHQRSQLVGFEQKWRSIYFVV